MATANDLLTRAIDETKHLNHNEIFLVRDLFKGYEWNRISRSDRLLLLCLMLQIPVEHDAILKGTYLHG